MKFIHTADWQIGMRAAHVGAAAEEVRGARLRALKRLVTLARDHAAEFILVAGDAFEHHGVQRILVQQVADILADFRSPVFLLPGNHDPLVPGSVWEHPAWAPHPNAVVLTGTTPLEIPGGVLLPCPARAKHSSQDPTCWIRGQERRGICIGVAHGTVEGVPADEPDYPIARNAAQLADLDYLALGHWHSQATYSGKDGAVRMAYCGTHEPSRFGERESGQALLVEIEREEEAPKITTLPTGVLSWESRTVDLTQEGDLQRLRADLERLSESKSRLLDLRLTGLIAASESSELERLQELAAARFLFSRINTQGIRVRPDDHAWIGTLPIGPIRAAAAQLQMLAAGSGERRDSETATRALLELYKLARNAAL